jgi:hypothetical protein
MTHKKTAKGLVRFEFADHPWIAYLSLSVILIIMILIVSVLARSVGIPSNAPYRPLIVPTVPHVIVLFIAALFIFRIPIVNT